VKVKASVFHSQVAEVGNAQEGLVCGARLVIGSNPILITQKTYGGVSLPFIGWVL
jgi:hypothetical protein